MMKASVLHQLIHLIIGFLTKTTQADVQLGTNSSFILSF